MSIYQTHLDVTVVKCLVTTKINVVDTLYAATVVSLNIVDHLACVTNQPNVSTAQVITLQTRSNAHNGRKRRKFSKSNVKTTYHFLMLVNNTSIFTQVKLMQVLLNQALSKQCPQWEKEKKILKIKCENNLSFPDARKQYEHFYTGQTYASAVKSGTCNKSTQTDNKSTQTDDSFTEYLKQTTEVQRKNLTHLLIQEKVTPLILDQPLRGRP